MSGFSAADLARLSQETTEMIRKSTSGLLVSTGIQGYDLSGLVSLVPVNVPARNNTSAFPRVIAGEGSQNAVWRALLNVNSSQPTGWVGRDYSGTLALINEQDVYAPYQPVAVAGRVTLDAVAFARNFADALSVEELQVLNQLFIQQDMGIINGQAWSTGAPGTPTLTTATSGGSIAHNTAVYVGCCARSGANYFEGGNSAGSSTANVTTATATGSNANTVTATLPAAIKGAVAYDWYVGTSGTQYYYTTTTTTSVTITSVPTAAQALPSLALLSSTAPASTLPTADTSFSTNYYNGVIASTLGDYGTTGPVAPGSGTATGATWIDNGGNAPVLSGGGIDILDTINDKLWASVQLSPTAYMLNSAQADEISKQLLGSSSAVTYLPPTDADARTNLAGGGYVGRYINRAAGGVPVAIEVHPRMAPGTIVARTDRVPFPGSNIGTAFQVRCQYDSMRFDYAASYSGTSTLGGGPRYDFEVRSLETLVNVAPVAQAVACNIG